MNRLLSLLVIVLGVACLGIGAFFLYQAASTSNYLTTNIKQEKITLGLSQDQISAGQVDFMADQLQKASEQVRSDRHNIAATYNDLLGGQHYNPTDPKQLTWAQALNLESSLNLAILSYGVIQIAEGAGAFMIIVAIALWAIGIVLWRLSDRKNLLR
jgi:hypothetical protein